MGAHAKNAAVLCSSRGLAPLHDVFPLYPSGQEQAPFLHVPGPHLMSLHVLFWPPWLSTGWAPRAATTAK